MSQIKRQNEKSEDTTCLKIKVWHNRFVGNQVFIDLGEELDNLSYKMKSSVFQLHNDY